MPKPCEIAWPPACTSSGAEIAAAALITEASLSRSHSHRSSTLPPSDTPAAMIGPECVAPRRRKIQSTSLLSARW